jgi:cellulose synthase/poly-beta-1,6-N-acetylglucosamine synthase-like glycosyltransferase
MLLFYGFVVLFPPLVGNYVFWLSNKLAGLLLYCRDYGPAVCIYCSGIGPNNILRTKQKTVDWVSCMYEIYILYMSRPREGNSGHGKSKIVR